MTSLDRRIVHWMRQHHSIVSAAALQDAGISPDQRDRLVGGGMLDRVLDGAYRFAGSELDELGRCTALCVARPQLVIAGPTAGRTWAITRSPRDGLIHAIGPPASHPCVEPWVRVYRTALIFDDEIVHRPDGIRLTCPPLTVVDLTRHLRDESLATAIESVLHRELCTEAELFTTAERRNTPGRPWVRRFLRVLAGRSPGSPRESGWETRVFEALTRRGITGMESQATETLAGYGKVRFDIAVPAIMWVLEVDVHPEHRTLEGQFRDHRRTRHAREKGWYVEQTGEAELAADFDGAIDAFVASIRDRRSQVHRLQQAGLWPPR